jgi:hypothetical protein
LHHREIVLLLIPVCACSLVFGVDGYEGSQVDGGVDAGPEASCVGFCDNFDDRPPPQLQGHWDSLTLPTKGVAEISDAEAKSPPQSAHFSLLPLQDGGNNNSFLRVSFPLGSSHAFALDFDFSLAYTPAEFVGDSFANILYVGPGGVYGGGLGFSSGKAAYAYYPFLPDGAPEPTQTEHFLDDIRSPPGAWKHFHFEETFDKAAGRVYGALDGVKVFEDVGVDTLPPGLDTAAFAIGVSLTRTTSAVEVYFDNVQIRPLP